MPSGASTKNAGFACIGSPSELLDDIQQFGEDLAFSIMEKRHKGLQNLQKMLGNTFAFQQSGAYEVFQSTQLFESIVHKLTYLNEGVAPFLGNKNAFEILSKSALKKFGFSGFKNALKLNAEGTLNPFLLTDQLLTLSRKLGINILNGINIHRIEDSSLISDYGAIEFNQLAICTNGFAKQLIPDLDIKAARAQVIVSSPIKGLKFQGSFHFDRGYYYFRNIGNRVLFGGGRNTQMENEYTEDLQSNDDLVLHLKELLQNKIIPNQAFSIDYKWAGTMGLGQNKMPIIKKFAPNQYCAVRLGGMGVAIGVETGRELADLIP